MVDKGFLGCRMLGMWNIGKVDVWDVKCWG